jgi:predicted ribosome quality control (RQC) complex YloA/Tae2 family protein
VTLFSLLVFIGLLSWIAFLMWDRSSLREDRDWHISRASGLIDKLQEQQKAHLKLRFANNELNDRLNKLDHDNRKSLDRLHNTEQSLSDTEEKLQELCEIIQETLKELK